MIRNIIIFMVALVMLSGCAGTAKLYDGEKLEDEIAILFQKEGKGNFLRSCPEDGLAQILTIDKKPISLASEIQLIPGEHDITIHAQWDFTGIVAAFFELSCYSSWCHGDIQFTAKANHKYYLVQDVTKRPIELAIKDYSSDTIVAKGVCSRACDDILLNQASND
jgi:hypothetical protein